MKFAGGNSFRAAFLLGFVPILFTAFAFRELNKEMPDCGVTQARRYGTFGINKPWSQLKDQRGIPAYPMFGGASFQPPEWS